MIAENAIETPHLRANLVTAAKISVTDLVDIANLLTVASGKIVIGANALGAGLPGLVVNDGTYNRWTAGEQSAGVYGTTIRDASGNVTVDLGNIMGASNYQYVAAENEISTNATSLTDMTNMSITHTYPKCIALLLSVCRLDTLQDDATNALVEFDVAGAAGFFTGIAQNIKAVATNMHIESLAAGSHTIKLRWYTSDVTSDFIYCTQRRLMILYWEVQ